MTQEKHVGASVWVSRWRIYSHLKRRPEGLLCVSVALKGSAPFRFRPLGGASESGQATFGLTRD